MSFLVGRLAAGKEGAFFFQESKHAVGRLVDRTATATATATTTRPPPSTSQAADVLPEILKHSLPSKVFQPPSDSSLSTASKWVLPSDPSVFVSSVSPDAINPLRAYVSLPQVTFGPKRWRLPNTDNSFSASTANELRRDKYTPISPEKFKAAAVGFSQIAKAFAVATAIVFGGASLTVGLAVSQLELHTTDDIRTKGKDIIQPKFISIKEQVIPLRTWAEGVSKKWHTEREENIKEKPLVKELSKMLGAKRHT